MVGTDIFLIGLMLISTLSSLTTEAIKKILKEHNIKYHANTLAGIITALLSIAVGTGYVIISGISFSAQVIVCIIALTFIGWLCAMVGYDKVITQFKTTKKDDD